MANIGKFLSRKHRSVEDQETGYESLQTSKIKTIM